MTGRRTSSEKSRAHTPLPNLRQIRVAPPASTDVGEAKRRPLLFVIQGPLLGTVISIKGASALIGRGLAADVLLRDETISRAHARVSVTEHGIYIADLQSQGGTFVNDAKVVGSVKLHDGDRLRFGRGTVVKFSLVDAVEENALLTLFELTLRDPLTRTYNRRYFDRRLHEEFSFARRQQSALSLLLIDIDHFKRVNDKYGHPVGDMVLELVAASIQKVTRPEDVLARYGGEEFVVIARGASSENAEVLAERIRRHVLALSVPLPGAEVRVTVSVGVATMSADSSYPSCEELVVAVDDAMYQAKSLGRNRACRAPRGVQTP
jgi:diguanylate cyclase (GGDEF)-like protein